MHCCGVVLLLGFRMKEKVVLEQRLVFFLDGIDRDIVLNQIVRLCPAGRNRQSQSLPMLQEEKVSLRPLTLFNDRQSSRSSTTEPSHHSCLVHKN